mgnify:CR=1 FL=1
MKNLINTLTEQTQELRVKFIEQTEQWAEKQWKLNLERKNKYFNSKIGDYKYKQDYYDEQKYAYNTPNWHFTPEFIVKSIEKAEQHYTNSVEKLAYRIIKKGLNADKITMKTGYVGVNLETTFTDGNKTVTAFTVLASGQIQRPHYRYLIK